MKGFWLFAIGALVGVIIALLPKAAAHLHSAMTAGVMKSGEQRLHTDRTNWTLLIFLQTPMSETADYTGARGLCQAQARQLSLKTPT